METIKVNMSPNPLDVQTIHASQNDGEAREWGFELHNNGDVIDASEVTDQLVFKAYEGGTEQILPENGSTPTTSPFLGDIKYPQGLLTDQEFLYRESPTEEDGLAKITDIKGNTLVWNQKCRVENVNYSDEHITITRNTTNGTVRFVSDGQNASFDRGILESNTQYQNKGVGGHRVLFYLQGAKNINGVTQKIYASPDGTWGGSQAVMSSSPLETKGVYTIDSGKDYITWYIHINANTACDFTVIPQMIDLALLNDSRITDLESFKSYYPLDYYSYNQGSLLSFNGNGIKTVGKNQIANIVKGYFNAQSSTINVNNEGESFIFYALKDKTYYASSSITLNRNVIAQCNTPNLVNGSPIYNPVNLGNSTEKKWTATWTGWTVWYVYNASSDNVENSAQVEIGISASEYKPYVESTLSLPISTYFPTGMKSAGTVYDELIPTKAITRIGAVDLGSFTWSYNEQYQCFTTYPVLTDAKQVDSAVVPNFTSIYKAVSWSVGATDATQDMATCFLSSANQLRTRNKNFTDATAFKSAMNGVYLYYELATPTETPITTASLVTENAEIPLSNDDGVLIGKCTEELSENPGFIDAKIKLSDADGECYSNKLQLHVERSPQ